MIKRISLGLLLMTVMLFSSNHAGAGPEYVTIETVKYACIVSPPMEGHVEGQWTTDCAGNRTGWGWEPGSNCSYTEVTYGAACGGGGGPDPGGCRRNCPP
jgi:hypothetical protein